MSEQEPYQLLGVPEDASFEEIKAARDQLMGVLLEDEHQQQRVEQAYDAILMQRLRLRREGKITVPEGIRFPERQDPPTPPTRPRPTLPKWIDTPSRSDMLLTLGLMSTLVLLSAVDRQSAYPSWQLALAILVSIYLLYRKQRKFGRALLLSLAGFTVGLTLAFGLTAAIGFGGSIPGLAISIITLAVMAAVALWLR